MTKTQIQMRHPSERPEIGVPLYIKFWDEKPVYSAVFGSANPGTAGFVWEDGDLSHVADPDAIESWCYARDLDFLPPKPPMPTVGGVSLHPMDVTTTYFVLGFRKSDGCRVIIHYAEDREVWCLSGMGVSINPDDYHGWLGPNELRLAIDGEDVE